MTRARKKQGRARYTSAARFFELAEALAGLGRNFYALGWALGTSGNFSAVVSQDPLRLAITPSGVDKGTLTAGRILKIDANGKAVAGSAHPSAEAQLHLAVVRERGARAVLHTHSVWSTVLSETCANAGGVPIESYEMLKGLEGVQTHEHREWLPIIDNSQDYRMLAQAIQQTLRQHPSSHGFLLCRHGLCTWGRDLAEAKRHLEILEFLLEAVGQTYSIAECAWRAAAASE